MNFWLRSKRTWLGPSNSLEIKKDLLKKQVLFKVVSRDGVEPSTLTLKV